VAYGLRLLGVPVQLLSSQDDLSTQLRSATVVVSATGKSNFIQSDWLQPGEVLIDVGAPTPEFQPACYEQCRFYTPVPFGVGPLTRYCLLENLFK
jgi:methylenetetrahydrofolate dehydrogenase (NADP+)/methenyltetrahydrofolate cyclohydrolase